MTLYAQPNAPIEPTLVKAPTGLVGDLGFKILDPSSGEIMSPHRQAGITEPVPGTYWTAATAPNRIDTFLLVWDYIDPAIPDTPIVATEDLRVTASVPDAPGPAPVGLYCVVSDVRNYAKELALVADEEVMAKIILAQQDCDLYSGFGGVPNDTSGLRFDPVTDLEPRDMVALNRACCAQVQFRFYMGDSYFVDEVGYKEISGEQSVKKPSRFGPQMKAEFPRSLTKHTGSFS